MMPEEKTKLLELFDDERRWCRNAEARDENDQSVHYDDAAAVAWDLTGALCHLFGWPRALVLFGQVQRHIAGNHRRVSGWPTRLNSIEAMQSLQEFNDGEGTRFPELHAKLECLPVWKAGARSK